MWRLHERVALGSAAWLALWLSVAMTISLADIAGLVQHQWAYKTFGLLMLPTVPVIALLIVTTAYHVISPISKD